MTLMGLIFALKGTKGENGNDGDPGDKGDKGDKGDPGESGLPYTSQCLVTLSEDKEIPKNEWTVLELDNVVFDNNDEFSNYIYTAKDAGYYFVHAKIWTPGHASAYNLSLNLDKNDVAEMQTKFRQVTAGEYTTIDVSKLIQLNVDDTVRTRVHHTFSTVISISNDSPFKTYFWVFRIK